MQTIIDIVDRVTARVNSTTHTLDTDDPRQDNRYCDHCARRTLHHEYSTCDLGILYACSACGTITLAPWTRSRTRHD